MLFYVTFMTDSITVRSKCVVSGDAPTGGAPPAIAGYLLSLLFFLGYYQPTPPLWHMLISRVFGWTSTVKLCVGCETMNKECVYRHYR